MQDHMQLLRNAAVPTSPNYGVTASSFGDGLHCTSATMLAPPPQQAHNCQEPS